MTQTFDTIIVGAGIAGAAAAYYLSRSGRRRIGLIDRQQPLSLTTRCSGENYRNFWPQPCMTSLSSRSMALMDELVRSHDTTLQLKRTGYQFVSRDTNPFAASDGIAMQETTDTINIRERHPYLSEEIRSVTHINDAGAFDVYGLGSLLLKAARQSGVSLIDGEVATIDQQGSAYTVTPKGDNHAEIKANNVVIAAGPFTDRLLAQLDIQLPIEHFRQQKFVIEDPEKVIPRDMPFTICADELSLSWSDEETEMLASDDELSWMLKSLPPGLHAKPEGQTQIKLGWAFNRKPEPPQWQCHADPNFPELVMRGAMKVIPRLETYVGAMPVPVHQFAGYYSRTPENWPIIGPLPLKGLYTISALSGFGTMVACAAGELLTAWLNESELPEYADHFAATRYQDDNLIKVMQQLTNDGQL